jgi:hypothetical protein
MHVTACTSFSIATSNEGMRFVGNDESFVGVRGAGAEPRRDR